MDLRRALREEVRVAALAAQFLTRVPVSAEYSAARMAASPRWYPGIGIALGLGLAVAMGVAGVLWPGALSALVVVALGALVTGALHEDGFADVCDGLGGGATPERALEIMRDSRLGAYGALGLGLLILGKVLALGALPLGVAMATLIAAHGASRGAMVWVMETGRYVRAQGAGSAVATGLDARGRRIAALLTLVSFLPLLSIAPAAALIGALGCAMAVTALRWRIERRLGGYTGDCLGAVQQIGEVGLYLGVAAWL